jgi:hypothetical protein
MDPMTGAIKKRSLPLLDDDLLKIMMIGFMGEKHEGSGLRSLSFDTRAGLATKMKPNLSFTTLLAALILAGVVSIPFVSKHLTKVSSFAFEITLQSTTDGGSRRFSTILVKGPVKRIPLAFGLPR